MVALNKTYQKTLTPDRSAKDSGHRYYSPEISRWLNRDPIGEMDSPNLFVFVRNDACNKSDALGLAADFYSLWPANFQRCNRIALQWVMRRDIANCPTWNDYVRELQPPQCDVRMTCDPCCRGSSRAFASTPLLNYLTVWRTGGATKCDITFCVDNITERFGAVDITEFTRIAVHELTHCQQRCRGYLPWSCKDCVCGELQAAYRQHPTWNHTQLKISAKRSCVGESGSGRCADMGKFDDVFTEAQPNEPEWIEFCKERE
jgi:RHS repeat-associated protein